MLTMLGILFFGTYQVFNGALTVGALIAFNMLAGQVSQPILRLAQLWQQFQQARVGVARLLRQPFLRCRHSCRRSCWPPDTRRRCFASLGHSSAGKDQAAHYRAS